MNRSLALLLLLARSSGAAAAALAIPLLGGVGLAAAILFAGNGLTAHDVVTFERTSLGGRAALWTGWLVLSIPPARALLTAPSAAWLRSLPVPRAWFLAALVVGLIALQGPWIVLFARHGGALAGLGAGVLAAALAAGGASFRSMRWGALTLAAPLAALAAPLPLAPSIALALPACWLAADAGFFRGTALPRGAFGLVRGPAAIALAGALAARLVRSERVAVLRALLAAAAGGALGAIGARNNDPAEHGFSWIVLPIATLPLLIGASVMTGPLVRAEAALTWLLDTMAARARTRVAARFIVSLAAGAVAGLAAAAGFALVPAAPRTAMLQATFALVTWGASIGALAASVLRRSARAGKREGGVLLAGLSVLGIALLIAAGFLEGLALAMAPLAVLVAAAADSYHDARRP